MSKVRVLSLVLMLAGVMAHAQQPRQVEYFFDTDPGYGKAKRLSTTVTGNNQMTFDLEGISPGSHTLYVRCKDSNGHWSTVMSRPILVTGKTPKELHRLEFFIDTDPGYGLGSVISNLQIGGNTLTFDLSAATDGAHVLYVRSQDETGLWSVTMSRPLFIDRYQDIVYVEYFYDDNDPGIGNARPLPLPDVDYKGHLDFSADFDITGLSLGVHKLTVRARDRYDQWTNSLSRSFTIVRNGNIPDPPTPPVEAGDLARLEYFFDADPGYGKGRALTTPNLGTNTYTMSFEGLNPGAHVVYLRAWDDHNNWSQTLSRPVYVCSVKGQTAHRLEFFFDKDPGYGNAMALQQPLLGENSYVMPLNDISTGAHVLNLRAQNEQGRWSAIVSRPLYVIQPTGELAALEYFFDSDDPGQGRANAVQLPGNLGTPFAFDVPISSLSAGRHQFNVRAASDDNHWSVIHSEPFEIVDDSNTGIKTVERLLPISMTATERGCVLRADNELASDCIVEVVSVSGMRLATQLWPAGLPSLTIPISVASGTVLIVSVSEANRQLRMTQRMIAK